MGWVEVRSRRDPAVWLPIVGACVIAAVAALLGQRWMAARLAELAALAASDPEAARHGAEAVLRALLWAISGFALLCGALFARMAQLGLREGRLPPSGWWSLGAYRVATGATARRLAVGGLVLAGLLALLGVASLVGGERLLATLAAPTPAP